MRASSSIAAAVLAWLCLGHVVSADELKFGDAASETAHRLLADKTIVDTGGLGERCRRIEPGGALVFNLSCDPDAQNYLTVKFWGSDGDVATLFLCVGDKRIGAYGDPWPELDLSPGGAAFPGRFYYTTYMVPRQATAGKRTVTLKLAAVGALAPYAADPAQREKPQARPTRGIYRAYSGADPFFTPSPDEAQGRSPPARRRPKPAGFPDIGRLRQEVDDAIARLMRWQIYGPAWETAVAEHRLPAIARGANPSQTRSDQEWRDFVAYPTTQNGLPLNAFAVFARAYQSPWSRHHHNYEAMLTLPPDECRLPMEDGQPDFAWADEQGATVAVKHGGARLYVSLNWRRGFKDGKRDPEHVQANNIARVHYTTPTVDRIATIAMESPHGFGKLYVCHYGPYRVAMNASQDAAYDVPLPAGAAAAVDLVSGKPCPAQGSIRLPPSTTAVLDLGDRK